MNMASTIQTVISAIPQSSEAGAVTPEKRAQKIMTIAASKAAVVSGTLSLPPGPMGMLTVLPDLVAVWKIQAQMVADIASTHGKQAELTREHMLYCLFRHSAAQAIRDIAVRSGERLFLKQVSTKALQSILAKVGVRVSRQLVGRAVSRWVPIVGAMGVAGYAYYDTMQVGKTARLLFQSHSID